MRAKVLVPVTVAVVVVAGLSLYAVRSETPPPVAISPTPTPTAVATPSPTAAVSTSPPSGRHVNAAMGYSIELRQPWRRAACGPSSSGPAEGSDGLDLFVTAPDSEVQFGIGTTNTDHIVVVARANPEGLSLRAWKDRFLGQSISEKLEDTTFAGRPALLRTDRGSETFVVADGAYMYQVGHEVREGRTSLADRAAIVRSFRFLTADEARAARALATPTPAPRTVETVANALADGFAKKDVSIVARVAGSCLGEGGAQAGLSSSDTQTFLGRLRDAFARGLAVEVRPRPIDTQRGFGQSIRGTWREPGQPDHEVELVIVTERGTAFWGQIVHYR